VIAALNRGGIIGYVAKPWRLALRAFRRTKRPDASLKEIASSA
jgi:hypothetical protein